MRNLRVLSMNLGKTYIPVKDKSKKQLLASYINEEGYNIVMLQGNSLTSNINFSKLNYNAINYQNRMAVLYDRNLDGFDIDFKSKVVSSTVIFNKGPIAFINVNCDSPKNMEDVFKVCEAYNNPNTEYTLKTRIIAGKFPKEVDINLFCDMFDLDDVSTLIGRQSHIENNREMLNHFFISRNLEALNVRKLVGMTEISKIGQAYPIEASISYKKVLK